MGQRIDGSPSELIVLKGNGFLGGSQVSGYMYGCGVLGGGCWKGNWCGCVPSIAG